MRTCEPDLSPLCLTVYSSLRCNLDCAYCFTDRSENRPDVTTEAILEAADEVIAACKAEHEPFTVAFHGGGEPTLDPRLPSLVRQLQDKAKQADVPIRSYLATNGIMSPEKCEEMAELFDEVGLSADGMPELHNANRPLKNGGPSFSIVKRSAAIIKRIQKRLVIRVTLREADYEKLPQIIRFFRDELSADLVRVEPEYGVVHGPDAAVRFAASYRDALSVGVPLEYSGLSSGRYCNKVRRVLQLIPGDRRSPCFRQTQYDRLHEPDLSAEDPECMPCRLRPFCARGCPDVCAGEDKDAGSFRCQVNRLLADVLLPPQRKLYRIPLNGQVLLYRPLQQKAFIGNVKLAELAEAYCRTADDSLLREYPDVEAFFRSVGFTEQDPPEPESGWETRPFRPTSAALLMTNRCNLRCIYCYANGGEENSDNLPLAYGKQAIDFVSENAASFGTGPFDVCFHGGGEPALCRETIRILAEHARRKPNPANLSMVTNGTWDQDTGEEWISLLNGMTISMDGAAVTQNRQRPFAGGNPSFDRVFRSVRQLSDAGFPFGIRMTVTPEGFDALSEDVRFLCEETGARQIQAEPAFNTLRGMHAAAAEDQDRRFAEAYLAAYDIAVSYGKELFYSGGRPNMLTDSFCTAPLGSSFTVNPRGEITGCYEITGRDGHPDGVFGKMDENGFIINEAQRLRFVREILHRKDRCRNCFCYYHCAGDCFSRGSLRTDDGPYARCRMNRMITLGLILRSVA